MKTLENLCQLTDKELDILVCQYIMGWHIGDFLGETCWLEGNCTISADFVWSERVGTGYTLNFSPSTNQNDFITVSRLVKESDVPSEATISYYEEVMNEDSTRRPYMTIRRRASLMAFILATQDLREVERGLQE